MIDIRKVYPTYKDVPGSVQKQWAGMIAQSVTQIADRHGYGLGECRYYFDENAEEQLEYATEAHSDSDKRQLANAAEEVAMTMQEYGL